MASQWHSCHFFFYFDHNCADFCETDILWKLDFQMFPSLDPFIGKLKSWTHLNLKIAVYSRVIGWWDELIQCSNSPWFSSLQYSRALNCLLALQLKLKTHDLIMLACLMVEATRSAGSHEGSLSLCWWQRALYHYGLGNNRLCYYCDIQQIR